MKDKTLEERIAAHLFNGVFDEQAHVRLCTELVIPASLEQARALSVLPSMKEKTPAELAKLACDITDAVMQEAVKRCTPR